MTGQQGEPQFTFEVFVDGVSEGTVTTSKTGPGTPLGLATSTGVTADLGQFVVVCEEPEPGFAFDFPTFVNAEAGDPDGEGRPCFGFTVTENQFNSGAVRFGFANRAMPEVEVVKFEDTDGSDGFTYNVDEGLAGFEGPPVDRSPRLGGNHVSDGGEADPNAA